MRRDHGVRIMSTSIAAFAALAFVTTACGKKAQGQGEGKGGGGRGGGAPVSVRVAVAQRVNAPITVTASGVVDPMQTAAVQSQVSGVLQSVEFAEGAFVRPGQVLFRIDPRPLLAAVAQARATLARDQAQAEAGRRNDIRYQTLVAQDYVAREEADQVHAQALASAATVAADRAALSAAEVNLSYATIRAPIAGKTGAILVRAGNLVGPNSGPLVVINQLSPVQVRFPVLAADLSVLQSALARGPLEVTATGSDGTMGTEAGRLSFLDNSVDSLTGTVTGKAVFQNGSGFFWPGQLVFLTVRVGVQNGVLAVPSAAILTGQQGSYVYVVDPQRKTARTQNVTAGRTVGDLSLVSAGLAPGMTVVVDGQSRLKPGSKVTIVTGSGDGPGSVAGGGPPGSSSMPQSGAVAAGSTGPGGGDGGPGDGGPGGGGSGAAGGGQPGSVTAGVQRTNGAARQTSAARTGGGASVANPGAPTTTPTGARSGTGAGSASPVATPLPGTVRGVIGNGGSAGATRGGGSAGGTPGGVTAGVGSAGGAGAGTPAGGGRP